MAKDTYIGVNNEGLSVGAINLSRTSISSKRFAYSLHSPKHHAPLKRIQGECAEKFS